MTIWHQFLTNLDLSQNTLLESLNCTGNQLAFLDVSNNTALISLVCAENQLTELDIRNNSNTLTLNTTNNLNLNCINVDDSTFSANNWINNIDPQHYFSNNCSDITALDEILITYKLIKTIDIFGRKTTPKLNMPLFYIYEDGTVEKKIIVEYYKN